MMSPGAAKDVIGHLELPDQRRNARCRLRSPPTWARDHFVSRYADFVSDSTVGPRELRVSVPSRLVHRHLWPHNLALKKCRQLDVRAVGAKFFLQRSAGIGRQSDHVHQLIAGIAGEIARVVGRSNSIHLPHFWATSSRRLKSALK